MIRKREVKYVECDGCGYVISEGSLIIKLLIPMRTREMETFHFHNIDHKTHHDCLRYWFMNPRVITESLRERGYHGAEIDNFLSKVSYREKEPA